MPVLKNAKHEKFAQAIAQGQSLAKAAEKAGYAPRRGNAHRIRTNEIVSRRIDEILSAAASETTKEIVYTRETLLAELDLALKMAQDLEKPTAMVQASIGKARVLGLIIDRREIGDAGAFDAFTDEELVSAAAKRARELGIAGPRPVDEEPVDDEDPA
jgi:hypothetical protein